MSKKISQLPNLNDISSTPANIIIPVSNTVSSITNSVRVDTLRNYVNIHANSAYASSNTVDIYAQAAFAKANSALANTTGTFAGDLTVTGNVITSTSLISSTGMGYKAGTGGQVTQTGSRTDPITLDALTGRITLFNTITPAEFSDTFTFNNSFITNTDLVYVAHIANGTMALYDVTATPQNGSAIITFRNNSNDPSPPEAPILGFMVFKSSIS
jgi:hypothetical protein